MRCLRRPVSGAVIALIHLLMREKTQLRSRPARAQQSTLDHSLSGGAGGTRQLLGSRYALSQAAFMLRMTVTVAYFRKPTWWHAVTPLLPVALRLLPTSI
jgi:hypothetical protein